MSSSDAASQDSSNDFISNIPSHKNKNKITPLHHPPLVSDSALPLLPSPSKQHAQTTSSHTSSDDLLNPLPLVFSGDDKAPIMVAEEEEEELLSLCADDGDEDSAEGITVEDLAAIYRTRRKEPPPGATRVLKTVRVRKHTSSSKRRTKKHTLRVQLKEKDRIEEEMAQFRGKGKGKAEKPRSSLPERERRYYPIEPGSSSQGPSRLRFSESCDYGEDSGSKGPGGEGPATSSEGHEALMERQRQAPAPPPKSDPDASMD